MMKPNYPDPVIDEIREIRHQISASCDHDPAKLVAHLMKFQEQYRDRLIYVPAEQPPSQAGVLPDSDQEAIACSSTPLQKS